MIRKARYTGEVFNLNGQKFKVIEGDCEDCYFLTKSYCFKSSVIDIIGECCVSYRKDYEDVCFQLVKDE